MIDWVVAVKQGILNISRPIFFIVMTQEKCIANFKIGGTQTKWGYKKLRENYIMKIFNRSAMNVLFLFLAFKF